MSGFIYSILKTTKAQRRGILNGLLKQFDDTAKSSLTMMLYLADNLAYIPYTVLDEPLYVIHHIDIMISVSGSNLLQTFKEVQSAQWFFSLANYYLFTTKRFKTFSVSSHLHHAKRLWIKKPGKLSTFMMKIWMMTLNQCIRDYRTIAKLCKKQLQPHKGACFYLY